MARPSRASSALLLAALLLLPGASPPETSGLRTYQLALIRRGPAWTAERTAAADSLQRGHMANIARMAEAGALVAAGPFLDGGDLRGIYLFTADSAAAAALAREDPAVRAGRLVLELHPLSARADIGAEYAARKARSPGAADSMVTRTLALLIANDRMPPRAAADSILAAHLVHLDRLAATSGLVVVGSVLSHGPLRTVLIFDADTARVRRAALEDPIVAGGWARLEIRPWLTAHGVIPAKQP